MILGIDEVGRGPWAGPLVVGAVVLGDAVIEGLTDSKKLSKSRREVLSQEILLKAAGAGLGWVNSDEIDEIGLSDALKLATRRAVEQIQAPYTQIIIDGTVNFLDGTGKGPYVTTMKKADLLIASVSAASVLAKVARDDYMASLDEQYPDFGFSRHVGYGTAAHRKALDSYGVTPVHRRSFVPIAARIGTLPERRSIEGTAKATGNHSETAATEWLQSRGYSIRERNWKTKFCEIDIVALKQDVLYFVEVKHRQSAAQGGGLAAITPRKLRQMRFAAALYLTRRPGMNAQLIVMTTSGTPPVVDELLPVE